MLEAKIIEIRLQKDERFGIDWNVYIEAAGAKRPISFPFTNQGILKFLPGHQRDYYPITTTSVPTAIADPGGQTTSSEIITQTASNFPQAMTQQGVDVLQEAVAGSIFSYGTLDFSQFKIIMQALDKRGDTETLSNPRLTTLNNQPAAINIGDMIYFPQFAWSDLQGRTVAQGFDSIPKKVGILLEATPHINEGNMVTVDLHTEISTGLEFVTLQNFSDTVLPKYTTRQAATQVMVQDGETIFIGGLISEVVVKQDNKLPILGDLLGGIPILGNAFRYESENVQRTEIVFFVTVHILRDGIDSVYRSETEEEYNRSISLRTRKNAPASIGNYKDEASTPVIMQGQLKVVENREEFQVPNVPEKKKKRKPFLDFRKKE